MENFGNRLENQNISWNSIKNFLEKQNTDKDTIDKIQSVFLNFDFTMDDVLGEEEVQKFNELFANYDTDKNGKLSDEEISTGESIFKTLGVELTNKFIDAVNNAEKSEDEPVETPKDPQPVEENNYEKDKDGNIITYPMEGETFKKTASRLGFKYGTDEYKEFVTANKKASARRWFIVGEKVKIPPSLLDKTVKEEIIDKEKNKEQIQKFKENYTARQKSTKKPEPKPVQKLPESVVSEMAKHKDCKLSSDKNGHILRAGREADTVFTEYNYDLKGKLISQKTGYSDGKTVETYIENGIKKTKLICKAAPEQIQAEVQKMKQISGGDAYLEYDANSKNYVCVQTGVKNQDVKEIKTQLKVGKEEIPFTGIQKFMSRFGIEPEREYRDSIVASSKITTYKNGRVVKGEPNENGKWVNTVITQAEQSQPSSVEKSKIYTSADISFTMPKGAPKTAHEFCDALAESKEKLMRQLDIDNDTYNMLAQTAVGIAGKETRFDQYWVREDDGKLKIKADSINYSNLGKEIARKLGLIDAVKWVMGDNSENSRGMTQLKFNLHTQEPEIKRAMDAFGITRENQLENPKNSAIATIIVLSTFNKRLNTEKYKKGIETAQGINVENEGWELNEQGIAEKTGNTKPWTNEITRQDALCALWQGGKMAQSVLNGEFKPQSWEYIREVKEFTNKYVLHENKTSRQQAEVKYLETKPFDREGNNGDMGSVVFLPGMYSDRVKHTNTPAEIQKLNQALIKKGIDANTRNQLIAALQNGELGFDFGLRQSEINSLTEPDIKLLLQSLHKLKNSLNINTSDGITAQEAVQLRKNSEEISKAEDIFRKEYLTRHSKVYNASEGNKKVLGETSTYEGTGSYVGINNQRRGFKHEPSKGVNINTTSGRISKQSEILANAANEVVKKNPNNINTGNCLTGVKEALENAGIDTTEMIKEGSIPKYAKNWFAKHPEMFTPVEYVATDKGLAREINLSDIRTLPAGYIVIFEPEENSSYGNQAGHIVITNGYGQGFSDSTDNLGWGIYSNNKAESGKGEHGKFKVYKLSDNWRISDGKLILKP